jgi:V-type H+-transporting ATPase subunit a
VPTTELANLRTALDQAARRNNSNTKPIVSTVETTEAPPTYLRTSKFTAGFQGLVNTYGIPRYREVNPGAFAIIFFPFLFGIMFGDVGHGSMLLLLALAFIVNEKKLLKTKLDDIVGMAFGGRYVLLLNAIFAIYVGFIYNEVPLHPTPPNPTPPRTTESGCRAKKC